MFGMPTDHERRPVAVKQIPQRPVASQSANELYLRRVIAATLRLPIFLDDFFPPRRQIADDCRILPPQRRAPVPSPTIFRQIIGLWLAGDRDLFGGYSERLGHNLRCFLGGGDGKVTRLANVSGKR